MIDAPDFKRSKRVRAEIDLSKLDRLPPHSIEAEQGVLGCVLLDPNSTIIKLRAVVREESFYDLRHQAIWTAIVAMNEAMKTPDLITLPQFLKDANQLEGVGGLSYLSGLQDAVPSAANLPYYLDILVEKYSLRRLLMACTTTAAQIYEQQANPDALLAEHREQVDAVQKPSGSSEMTAKQIAERVIDHVQAVHSGTAPKAIQTGIGAFDARAGGLWPGEMVIIAARPSVGKTMLLMQIACNVAKTAHVGVFSAEMGADSLMSRVMGGKADVNVRFADQWTQGDFKKFTMAVREVGALKLVVEPKPAPSIQFMRAKVKEWVELYGTKVVGVDYLQLCSTEKNCQSREQEISHISGGLKGIAKEFNLTMIVLSQLNRESEKQRSGKPKLSQMRESGAIEQDADTAALLYRDEDEDENDAEIARYQSNPFPVILDVQKCRCNGVFRVPLTCVPRRQLFTEQSPIDS